MTMKAMYVVPVLAALTVSACGNQEQAAQASPSVQVMNAEGEMAGEPSDTSVILQTRLTSVAGLTQDDVAGAPGVARFEWSESQDFASSNKTDWMKAVPEHDFIVKKRISGLKPGTRYQYRALFGADEKSAKAGPTRSFKTLPGQSMATPVNFIVVTGMNFNAFFRGARAYKGPDRTEGYPALKPILDANADFFVGTGDNVYYDSGPKHAQKTDDMRRFWHEQFVMPRMVKVMGQVAAYWQKDDHDTRYNDSDNTGTLEPLPALGKQIFEEQMPVRDPDEANALPYRTYRVSKDLQIWMTEGREYRSPNMAPDAGKTMWGAEQLAWLKRTLLESDATFKILISPTPMVGPDDVNRAEFGGTVQGARGRGQVNRGALPEAVKGQDELKRDNMTNPGGFKRERDEFFAWLKDNHVLGNNFYIICGDRHWQYYSIDPTGVEEFSTGAIVNENARLGRAPGDPLGNDPKALIKQPFTNKTPTGGFLEFTLEPGDRPKATIRWYDDHGVEQYTVVKEATKEASSTH